MLNSVVDIIATGIRVTLGSANAVALVVVAALPVLAALSVWLEDTEWEKRGGGDGE